MACGAGPPEMGKRRENSGASANLDASGSPILRWAIRPFSGISIMSTTKVAIVGLGTVGTGVARLLVEHGDRIARHAGRRLVLAQAVVNDLPSRATSSCRPA